MTPGSLAGYEDWPAFTRDTPRSTSRIGAAIGLHITPVAPSPIVANTAVVDEVEISRLRWNVGFGPDTGAWLLRPAGATGDLPGVLALHAHGGVASIGGEQLVGLADSAHPRAVALRERWYDGLAPANELARRGFAVLVHDAFGWASRGFAVADPADPDAYDRAAAAHEQLVAKAAGLLGTSFAGVVLGDDVAALRVLAGLDGVDEARLGVFGFSGGGGRAHLLAAERGEILAAVVSCMMPTFASLIPDHLDHSWLLTTPGLPLLAEWPELADPRPAFGLHVQFALRDELFDPAAIPIAQALLEARLGEAFSSSIHDRAHVFDRAMQREAWDYLERRLSER